MNKTIVTGGAGFIGSHLTERLLNNGHQVLVLDNCSTGRQENLESFSGRERFSFVRCDIRDFDVIQPLFEGADWVFHLAALADIVPSIQTPATYHQSNVDGTVSVLEAAEARSVSGRLVPTVLSESGS